MTSHCPRPPAPWARALLPGALGTLLVSAALAAPPQLEVPAAAEGYRDSVRCMPAIRAARNMDAEPGVPIRLPLEESGEVLQAIPLETSIDGDAAPDILVFGASTHTQSLACMQRAAETLLSLGVSLREAPAMDLEEQGVLPTEPLPSAGEAPVPGA